MAGDIPENEDDVMLRRNADKASVADTISADTFGGPSGEFARLRRLVNLSPAGIVETDAEGIIRFANPHWFAMLEDGAADGDGDRLVDLLLTSSRPDFQAALADLEAGAPSVSLDLAFARKHRTPLYVSSSLTALDGAGPNFSGIAAIFIDITERVMAEKKLQASETRLRQILDNTVALIGIMTPDGTLIEANEPALAGAGLTRADVVGKKFWDCYWWSHDPATMAELEAAIAKAADGQTLRYDATVQMAGGVLVPIDFMLSPVLDDDGNVELLVPSAFDISARKRSEEQLAFVMREVNHRSKNMLAVVQSILRQMRPSETTQFVRDFGARLRALSACQDLLVHSSNDSPALTDLVQAQLTHFAHLDGTRLSMTGPEIKISSEVAQNLGMAIYELATNAGKYGALSNATGKITITWHVTKDQIFHLIWQESGGPKVIAPDGSGFGTVVLEDMLAMALGATTQMSFDPSGLRWSLECPVDAITPR